MNFGSQRKWEMEVGFDERSVPWWKNFEVGKWRWVIEMMIGFDF